MVAEHDSLLLKLFGQNLNHKRLESKAQKAQVGEETLTPLDSMDTLVPDPRKLMLPLPSPASFPLLSVHFIAAW